MNMINNGCEVEAPTLNDAMYAVADLVLQFGYETTFRKCAALCDGGLSALENAFWELERAGCKINSNGTIQVKNLLKFMDKLREVPNG